MRHTGRGGLFTHGTIVTETLPGTVLAHLSASGNGGLAVLTAGSFRGFSLLHFDALHAGWDYLKDFVLRGLVALFDTLLF